MKYTEALDRVQAAQAIFADTSLTPAKFSHLQKLLKGVNPKLDKVLSRVVGEWNRLQRFEKGEVTFASLHSILRTRLKFLPM